MKGIKMETKPIIINLNTANQSCSADTVLLPNGEARLRRLIQNRLAEIEKYEKASNKSDDEYKSLKRHDSILIDGMRGIGKTTVLERLRFDNELKGLVHVLDVIDPNQLDQNTNILDIIVNNLFEVCLKEVKANNSDEKRELFDRLCSAKENIDNTIYDAEKKRYERKQYKSVSNKSSTTRNEIVLDETLHKYAATVCLILNKKALILPIDDIDMSLEYGSEIIETIRKYLQTPKIIPVVALDSAQIYALIKKQYFKKFGYSPKTKLDEIDRDSELVFLRKLPSAYIQKIMPPSQRIILPDMLGHYQRHLNNEVTAEFIYELSNSKSNQPKRIRLSFNELVKLILNVVFEYDGEKVSDPDDYHIINYLQNKTFRSFVDDAVCVLQSLNHENENSYLLDRDVIKSRFKLYSSDGEGSKFDSANWFWENYISKVSKSINEVQAKDRGLVQLKHAKKLLMVTAKDSFNLRRQEKIYHRLFLQDFYLKQIRVYLDIEKSLVEKVEKTISIPGFFEFVLRTVFPALLFEECHNNKLIDITRFPVAKLAEFAQSDSYSSLVKLYDDFVPFWTKDFPSPSVQSPKAMAYDLNSTKTTRRYRNKALNFVTKNNVILGKPEFYFHPFKAFAYFALVPQEISAGYVTTKSLEEYVGQSNSKNLVKQLRNDIDLVKTDKNYDITLSDTGLGGISSLDSVALSAKNLLSMFTSNGIDDESYENIFGKSVLTNTGLYDADENVLLSIDLSKSLASAEAIMLNCIMVNFMDGIVPGLDKSMIYTGINSSRFMIPYLDKNPISNNLEQLSNTKAFSPLINYVRLWFKTGESSISRSLLLNNRTVRNFNLLNVSFTNEKEFLQSIYEFYLVQDQAAQKSYYEVLIYYISGKKTLQKSFSQLKVSLDKAELMYKKFPHNLIDRKEVQVEISQEGILQFESYINESDSDKGTIELLANYLDSIKAVYEIQGKILSFIDEDLTNHSAQHGEELFSLNSGYILKDIIKNCNIIIRPLSKNRPFHNKNYQKYGDIIKNLIIELTDKST